MHWVAKKDGGVRIVSDNRKLNEATLRPTYPMTTAKQAVEAVPAAAQFFSVQLSLPSVWWRCMRPSSGLLYITKSQPLLT